MGRKLETGESVSGWSRAFERCWLRFLYPDTTHTPFQKACTYIYIYNLIYIERDHF